MNNNSNSHWFDHFITWPQHHRHHNNLPCGRNNNGGRRKRSSSSRTDPIVCVRFDMDATQTYSDHNIKLEECVEPMWFTSEELTLMDHSPYKEEEREQQQQQQQHQQRDCPNDNDNDDRNNTKYDDIVVDTLPSGNINDDDVDESDRKVKSKGDGNNDDRHHHQEHHHQRGLECTIPKLRVKRRLNIFHARSVVFQNQRRCDPNRLAKLYHNETRSVERDARRVGISDAKAVGMDPWPEATGFNHHRQALIFAFG